MKAERARICAGVLPPVPVTSLISTVMYGTDTGSAMNNLHGVSLRP